MISGFELYPRWVPLIRHARKRSEEIRGTKVNGVTVDQSLKTSTAVDRWMLNSATEHTKLIRIIGVFDQWRGLIQKGKCYLVCITGAVWAKRGVRSILLFARTCRVCLAWLIKSLLCRLMFIKILRNGVVIIRHALTESQNWPAMELVILKKN